MGMPSAVDRQAVAANVSQARQARGWTLAQAAARADASPQTWRRVEAGLAVRGESLSRVLRALVDG